jgi:hypothetical protein
MDWPPHHAGASPFLGAVASVAPSAHPEDDDVDRIAAPSLEAEASVRADPRAAAALLHVQVLPDLGAVYRDEAVALAEARGRKLAARSRIGEELQAGRQRRLDALVLEAGACSSLTGHPGGCPGGDA